MQLETLTDLQSVHQFALDSRDLFSSCEKFRSDHNSGINEFGKNVNFVIFDEIKMRVMLELRNCMKK